MFGMEGTKFKQLVGSDMLVVQKKIGSHHFERVFHNIHVNK